MGDTGVIVHDESPCIHMYHECVRRNRHAHPGRFDRTTRAPHIILYR